MATRDFQKTCELLTEAIGRAKEQGPEGFLEEAGLDQDGFIEITKYVASQVDLDRSLATVIRVALHQGYALAKLLEEK